jgi:NAD(P)-dependent dehydrogenase (short-subunit alcohol dehydrogenase family)
MDLAGRTTVVTGAGRGIGRALAHRFHAAGANVVLADVLADQVTGEAARLDDRRAGSATAVVVDLSTREGNRALVDAAEAAFGPVDLFYANAGVAVGTDLETTEDDWQLAFNVNVHAHRWAAERLLPGWLERGEGYFCSTASAAGLLAQIGSAPYSVTKHAAVAFAEWIAITYGDRGIRVSCLCPQGVNTDMLRAGDGPGAGAPSDVVRSAGRVLEPEEVAAVVYEAIQREQFLILPHPEVHEYLRRKADDPDRWIAGMRRLQARVMGAP